MKIDLDTPCDCQVCGCLPEGSWFRDWISVWPVTEAPHSYILMSAMGFLGGIIGRKVRWKDGNERFILPMINVLLIGPSGIGKTTSVNMARTLLPYIPLEKRPLFISGSATKEKLHVDLVLKAHAIVFAPELATFFSKEQYKEGLIAYVTQLLDYDRVEINTRKDGVTYVENPEVSLIGASTREWLTNMLPDTAASGGFLPRFLPVLEAQRGQRVANPDRAIPDSIRPRLEAKLEEVRQAFTPLGISEGEIDYEDGAAADKYTNWYNSNYAPVGSLAPFYARAGEMIKRMCILLAISARRKYLYITEEDVDGAVALYMYLCSKFRDITVATTPAGKLLQAVKENVTFEGTKLVDLYSSLTHWTTDVEIIKQVKSLVNSQQLRLEGDRVYRIK